MYSNINKVFQEFQFIEALRKEISNYERYLKYSNLHRL